MGSRSNNFSCFSSGDNSAALSALLADSSLSEDEEKKNFKHVVSPLLVVVYVSWRLQIGFKGFLVDDLSQAVEKAAAIAGRERRHVAALVLETK